MQNIYEPVIEKIQAAKARLAKLNIDRATADRVWDACPDLSDGVEAIEAWAEYHNENRDALDAHTAYGEIDRCSETLSLPLAKVETRYIITDGPLISPAGFYLDSGVYIKNDVWIETDRLPRSLLGLKAYDVQKDKEAA